MLVTNARSLAPKMPCFIENFKELDVSFAVISESWLKEGKDLSKDLVDLECGEGLKVIHKSRKSRRGRNVGGGIAIVYQKSRISLTERKIPGCGRNELVCAVGRTPEYRRKIVVYGIYVTLRLNAAQTESILQLLVTDIDKINQEISDPIIYLGGDFNHASINKITDEFPDLTIQQTAATRGDSTIDYVATNITEFITLTELLPPLTNEEDTPSDHKIIQTRATLPVTDIFEWKYY